jgi:Kdo2-lipid IVA lauroyltransferase/acyltransferase
VSGPAPRRHRRPHSPARASFEYGVARALLGALRALPLGAATAIAASVVGVVPLVASRLRRIGLDNLAHAFPESDAEWRSRVLREAFRNLGRLGAEVAHFDELDANRLHEIVGFFDDESERIWRESCTLRSAIVATGHFGNWELLAHARGLLARPIHLVHRPLRNPRVDDLVSAIRGRGGTGVIYKHAAAREILRKLRDGALVAIPIDQHAPGAEGAPIPFFGRPAATTLGPARLAQIARVPIYMAVLVREGTTNRHRICMRPSHPPPPPGKDPALLVDLTTRLVREFEDVVRAHPEQWLWMHRRWRLGGVTTGS